LVYHGISQVYLNNRFLKVVWQMQLSKMKQKQLKEIILCLGDRQQLSEITGKEYEYFKPEEIALIETKYTSMKQTFLEVELQHGTDSYKYAKDKIYDEAERLGADAIINFISDMVVYRGRGIYTGCVRGTPVKEITHSTDKKSG
jgi:hypothetical protein